MTGTQAIELKAFLPARDYAASRRFYTELGFEERSEFDGVAYFALGECAFLLQRLEDGASFGAPRMHLLVDDADAWHRRLVGQDIAARFGSHDVRMGTPEDRPWRIRDFPLTDPSGVLWRIGHNIG